jgi:hypothetical protein
MRTWLRLTCLFSPPDDTAECGNIVCASIGAILCADADDLVRGPLPRQLGNLLRQIAKAERGSSAESRRGVRVSDAAGLILKSPMAFPQRICDLPVRLDPSVVARPTVL